MKVQLLACSMSVVGACMLWSGGGLAAILSWVAVILFGCIGFLLGISLVMTSSKKYNPVFSSQPRITTMLFTKIMELQEKFLVPERKTVTTKNLDLAIEEIVSLVTRDYVLSWYNDLGKDSAKFTHLIQQEFWHMLEEFSVRLGNINKVKFITQDVVNRLTEHLQKIRLAGIRLEDGRVGTFTLYPWLASEERELEYLRKVSEVFLIYLLPKPYVRCNQTRHLLREILVFSVFKPAVELICDPDYLNQKIYGWLKYKEQLALEHKRTYAYAATYESFMKIIVQSEDIEHLKHIRYNVISEIMQATTIQNLKRAQGLDTDKEQTPKGNTKGDLLRARNLKRYINQLTIAKSHCEKRIHLLGGPDYSADSDDTRMQEQKHIPGKKVYSFSVIMDTAEARNHFLKYLSKDDKGDLLRFWTGVESMKHSSQRHWHNMGSDIYQMFIMPPTSNVRVQLDRTLTKGMESFLMGNTGPDAFYDAQRKIYNYLEEYYYPSFIISETYHRYIAGLSEGQESGEGRHGKEDLDIRTSVPMSMEDKPSMRIAAHSTYAHQKLQQISEKITNKTQALQAMRRSQRPDTKVMKMQKEIEDEIEQLKTEQRTLEFHIDRTEVWLENLTKWKAHISTAETDMEEEKTVIYFVILIHLAGMSRDQGQAPQSYTQGWVVTRKLQDFHALHHQLVMINPTLKLYELPRLTYSAIRKVTQEFVNQAKDKLDRFLTVILEDESLSQSEAMFAFFSPSPEHLKQAPTLSKKKFTFSNFFKSLSPHNQDSDSDDELVFVDEEGSVEKSRDSIAKPLYLLLAELFELKGVFKWLRRTLIAFVRVTYGRSINRQVRETVDWIVSEPMMIYYLKQFQEAYWPNGQLATAVPPCTVNQKLSTRRLAKEKFLQNMPDAMKNLFGEKNASRGAIKFFEAMQDIRLNKQIFYSLLEAFLYEAFPELLQYNEGRRKEPVPSDDTSDIPTPMPYYPLFP